MNRISEQSPSAERERAPGRHGRRRISEERAASGPWREMHLAPQGASTAGRGGVSTRPVSDKRLAGSDLQKKPVGTREAPRDGEVIRLLLKISLLLSAGCFQEGQKWPEAIEIFQV